MAADAETLRQIDELREEIAAKRAEREATRRRLHTQEERAAEMGRDTPPHISNEIRDLLQKRRDLDAVIAELGKRVVRLELAPTPAIEVLPHGDTPLPQLVPAVIDTRLQALERTVERQGSAIIRILQRLDDDLAWKEQQDSKRQDGQQGRARNERLVLLVLFVIALGVVFIAIRVS